MHNTPRRTGLAVVLAAAVAAVTATAGHGADGVISGLNSPRGISTASGKALVAESGDGTVAQLRGGENQASALAALPNVVDVALTGHGWEAYAITGGPPPESGAPPPPTASKLWHITSSGKVELVADIGAFQQTDPDPEDRTTRRTRPSPTRTGWPFSQAAGSSSATRRATICCSSTTATSRGSRGSAASPCRGLLATRSDRLPARPRWPRRYPRPLRSGRTARTTCPS
jgi:hypothetical protein